MQTLTNGGGRASNVELLRMLSMFLVLYVHANFFGLGAPTLAQLHAQPADATLSVVCEALAVVCVNVFVLISGWFGIRPKTRSISAFLFQCLFFLVGIYAVLLLTGQAELSLKGVARCFLLTKENWFPKAYLVLYILAPALNALVEHSSRQQLRRILFFYFLFQTGYDWIINCTGYLSEGYSPLSFFGLYLLARYVRTYQPRWSQLRARTDAWIYVGLCLLNAGGALAGSIGESIFPHALTRMIRYTNPLVIAAALFLLLAFTKVKLQSRFINWCAASAFAVFLFHTYPDISALYFKPLVQWLHAQWGAAYFVGVLPVLAGIFFLSVLLDQLRLALWRRVGDPVVRTIDKWMERL